MAIGKSSVLVDGSKLSHMRQAVGWTQEVAADRTGYSDRLIRKLESGGPVQCQTLRRVVNQYHEAIGGLGTPSLAALIRPKPAVDFAHLTEKWFQEVYHDRSLDSLDKWTHLDVKIRANSRVWRGREAIQQRFTSILNAFNPLNLSIEMLYVHGAAVIVYWRIRKRHVGAYLKVEPTGRWVTLGGNSLIIFRGCRIASIREHWDVHDLLQQLQSEPSA